MLEQNLQATGSRRDIKAGWDIDLNLARNIARPRMVSQKVVRISRLGSDTTND